MSNKDIKKMTLEELKKTYNEIEDGIDLERQIDICNQIIKLDPSDFIAFNNRGTAYTKLGKYNKAIEDYNKAIELDPKYFGAFNNRGAAYVKLREYNKAIEDYNKAIELNPNRFEVFNNRGTAYAKLGKYNKAIEDYSQAIKLNSEDAEAFYNRGTAYAELGKYNKVIEDYNQAIKLKPKYAEAFYNRGIIYRKLGNEEEAIENFKKVNEIDPSIIVQEGTKGLKKEVEDTQDFQTILEELEEGHQKDEKLWLKRSENAVHITLTLIVILLLAYKILASGYIYIVYVFLSIITFTIIRQYTNAKALRIEASNRVAMAKMFERVKSKEYNYQKEFLPKLADAIVYSTIKEKNSNGLVEKNSNGLVEKIIDIPDKLKK